MKVLTTAQMREVDRRTIALGIPGLILMENAGGRVVDFMASRFSPLRKHRIVVFCGRGNNGGDGMVIARHLAVRFQPSSLDVVLGGEESEFQGDAAEQLRMLRAVGVVPHAKSNPRMQAASIVVDALLGTGLSGPPRGRSLDLIREINAGFPAATVVAVDTPSGLGGGGETARADHTVTFTAPKVEQVLPPGCNETGELIVVPIGSPASLHDEDPGCKLHLNGPEHFRTLLNPRAIDSHKGDFGHVLVIGGAAGKGGAAAMSGLAALRAGAGLVTVAAAAEERWTVTGLAPELMTQKWDDSAVGKDVIAIGPGLGATAAAATIVMRHFSDAPQPIVADADALNLLANADANIRPSGLRVLTPHPGEMSRLAGITTADVQADRLLVAQKFAQERGVVLVLKGQRTVIAFPDGRAWINPTGSPAMATAGSGDILTGLLAGFLAQFPEQMEEAILAAVWLHGRSGEIGAAALSEQTLIATDLLQYLPQAIRHAKHLPDPI